MLHSFALWLCFLAGTAIYLLIRMSWTVRGNNAVKTRRQYLGLYWDIILIRQSIEAVLFWLAVSYPDAFTRLLALVHVNWDIDLPLIPPFAFLGGLAADVTLDYLVHKVPSVAKRLPELPRNGGDCAPTPAPPAPTVQDQFTVGPPEDKGKPDAGKGGK